MYDGRCTLICFFFFEKCFTTTVPVYEFVKSSSLCIKKRLFFNQLRFVQGDDEAVRCICSNKKYGKKNVKSTVVVQY